MLVIIIIIIIIIIMIIIINFDNPNSFIDNKANYLQLISLKKTIQRKHYLRFLSIKTKKTLNFD